MKSFPKKVIASPSGCSHALTKNKAAMHSSCYTTDLGGIAIDAVLLGNEIEINVEQETRAVPK